MSTVASVFATGSSDQCRIGGKVTINQSFESGVETPVHQRIEKRPLVETQ